MSAARTIFAAIVLVCVLAPMGMPLATATAGESCAMACCASRPMMEMGECSMHDAALKPTVVERDPKDPLCGVTESSSETPAETETITVVADLEVRTASAHQHPESNLPRVSRIRGVRCDQECATGVVSSSTGRNGRDLGAQVWIPAERVISALIRATDPHLSIPIRHAFRRRTIPRGPPSALQS